MSVPSKAWTPRQLAAVIDMSQDFVLAEIRSGHLSAGKFGNRWRIPASEVSRYLTARSMRFLDAGDLPQADNSERR